MYNVIDVEKTEVGNYLQRASVHDPTERRAKRKYGIPHRWHQVLSLHMSGKSVKEIMALTGYSQWMTYNILRQPEIIVARQRIMQATSDEFEALFPKVVSNIREQLDSEDEQVRLAAQTQFFKATGKFNPKVKAEGENVSAEDVVSKLLQQQININVNVQKD